MPRRERHPAGKSTNPTWCLGKLTCPPHPKPHPFRPDGPSLPPQRRPTGHPNPQLIHVEIDKRLHTARTADPVIGQRTRLELALAKTTTTITRMIEAFGEQLITIDELRARIPDLRAHQANLRSQLDALDNQLADQQIYLTLASDLETFLTQLRDTTNTASIQDRQRVLRLLVKDILVGPEKITIRHRIPTRKPTTTSDPTDTEGDQRASCQVRWGRSIAALVCIDSP
jgi:site-specific DNA recombinase